MELGARDVIKTRVQIGKHIQSAGKNEANTRANVREDESHTHNKNRRAPGKEEHKTRRAQPQRTARHALRQNMRAQVTKLGKADVKDRIITMPYLDSPLRRKTLSECCSQRTESRREKFCVIPLLPVPGRRARLRWCYGEPRMAGLIGGFGVVGGRGGRSERFVQS